MICLACQSVWTFGPGEREWYLERGLQLPRRCGPCRRALREQRASEPRLTGAVTTFNEERGHGYVRAEDGEVFFFRGPDVDPDLLPLRGGERVTFSVGNRHDGPKPRATLLKAV